MGLFREVGRRIEQFKQDAEEAAEEETDEDEESEIEDGKNNEDADGDP